MDLPRTRFSSQCFKTAQAKKNVTLGYAYCFRTLSSLVDGNPSFASLEVSRLVTDSSASSVERERNVVIVVKLVIILQPRQQQLN